MSGRCSPCWEACSWRCSPVWWWCRGGGAVPIWLAWLILTVLALFAGLDLSLGTYAAFTGMAVAVTAGMWWAERRRKSTWAARDHDLR